MSEQPPPPEGQPHEPPPPEGQPHEPPPPEGQPHEPSSQPLLPAEQPGQPAAPQPYPPPAPQGQPSQPGSNRAGIIVLVALAVIATLFVVVVFGVFALARATLSVLDGATSQYEQVRTGLAGEIGGAPAPAGYTAAGPYSSTCAVINMDCVSPGGSITYVHAPAQGPAAQCAVLLDYVLTHAPGEAYDGALTKALNGGTRPEHLAWCIDARTAGQPYLLGVNIDMARYTRPEPAVPAVGYTVPIVYVADTRDGASIITVIADQGYFPETGLDGSGSLDGPGSLDGQAPLTPEKQAWYAQAADGIAAAVAAGKYRVPVAYEPASPNPYQRDCPVIDSDCPSAGGALTYLEIGVGTAEQNCDALVSAALDSPFGPFAATGDGSPLLTEQTRGTYLASCEQALFHGEDYILTGFTDYSDFTPPVPDESSPEAAWRSETLQVDYVLGSGTFTVYFHPVAPGERDAVPA